MPFADRRRLWSDMDVNYMLAAVRDEQEGNRQ